MHDSGAVGMSLPADVMKQLQAEAAVMAHARHENVVNFMGICRLPPCILTGGWVHVLSHNVADGVGSLQILTAVLLMTLIPCCHAEYCGRGSAYSLLRQARQDSTMAAHLTWQRRLGMVREQLSVGQNTSACLLH